MSIKAYKLFVLSLFVILLSTAVQSQEEEENDNNKIMKELFGDLGLDKTDNMTREHLNIVLDKLLSKMYTTEFPQHSQFFKTIIEKYTAEVPEVFPKQDIIKYLNQEKIMSILQDVIKEQYGENYLNELKPAFDELNQQNLLEKDSGELDKVEEDTISQITQEENSSENFKHKTSEL